MKKTFFPILTFAFILVFSIVLTACSSVKQTVVIEVMSSSIQDGLVSGGGTFIEDEQATLIARPAKDKEFVAWIKNNKKVSDKAEFEFVVRAEDNGVYTAVFKSVHPTYYSPVAMSFVANEVESEEGPTVTVESIEIKFSSSNFSTQNTLHLQEDISLLLQSTQQASMIYEFEANHFFRVYSGYDKQVYTYTVEINYLLNQTKTAKQVTSTLAIIDLEEAIDANQQTYKFAKISLLNQNINLDTYLFFAPAGTTLISPALPVME